MFHSLEKSLYKSTFLLRFSVKKITSIFTSRHESILTLTSLTTKNGVQNELQEYKTELYEGVWSLVCGIGSMSCCCCWRNLLEEISFCKKLWRKDLLGRVFGIAACCCCCLDRMVVAVMVAGGQSGARMVPHLAKRAKESQRETRVVPLIIPRKEHLYL